MSVVALDDPCPSLSGVPCEGASGVSTSQNSLDRNRSDDPGVLLIVNPSTSEALAADLDGQFPAFVDAHGSMVLTLATRLTDPSTGQDIAQEVFLRAYQALDGYGRDRVATLAPRPWLATITRNLVRNEYRRRDRRQTVALAEGDEGGEDATGRDHFDAVESGDRLNQLLAELTDAQREAVVLRHVVGLSIRDVALTMACPIGTAKSHVSRGLDRLRAHLEAGPETGQNETGQNETGRNETGEQR